MEEFIHLARQRLGVKTNSRISIHHSGYGDLPAQKIQLLLLVMRNLLDNALEAAPGSQVRVNIDCAGDVLTISVEDSGPGLPEHVKANLFDPVKSTKENGTGIGLAISAVIARHIPSSLVLRKSDFSGTIFSIEMPL